MRRLRARDERGATAVIVAVSMVAMLGFSALAVDVGALVSDQKQLQNGADAAALAIAQACSKDACGDTAADALSFAKANKFDGVIDQVQVTSPTETSVEVTITSTRQLWFAKVLGIGTGTITRKATAGWGTIGAAKTVPLAVAECAFTPERLDNPTTGWVRLQTKGDSVGTGSAPCGTSTTPHIVPGGFNWLTPGGTGDCQSDTKLNDSALTSTGNTYPKVGGCNATTLQGRLKGADGPLLIPMFDTVTGTGSNAKYHLVGYAAFVPTAYCLANGVEWNAVKCTGSERWIEGYFVRKVALANVTMDPAAPDFGAATVGITK